MHSKLLAWYILPSCEFRLVYEQYIDSLQNFRMRHKLIYMLQSMLEGRRGSFLAVLTILQQSVMKYCFSIFSIAYRESIGAVSAFFASKLLSQCHKQCFSLTCHAVARAGQLLWSVLSVSLPSPPFPGFRSNHCYHMVLWSSVVPVLVSTMFSVLYYVQDLVWLC